MRRLARMFTNRAIEVLAEIMDRGENDKVRAQAAEALLDRGWGRPPQMIAVDNAAPMEMGDGGLLIAAFTRLAGGIPPEALGAAGEIIDVDSAPAEGSEGREPEKPEGWDDDFTQCPMCANGDMPRLEGKVIVHASDPPGSADGTPCLDPDGAGHKSMLHPETDEEGGPKYTRCRLCAAGVSVWDDKDGKAVHEAADESGGVRACEDPDGAGWAAPLHPALIDFTTQGEDDEAEVVPDESPPDGGGD